MQKGHRIDNNHNWIILNEFLAMPFSYMAFVIKDQIERNERSLDNRCFDLTPYNYLFNKSHAFIDSSFVRDNNALMEQVLENLSMKGTAYLKQLIYVRKQKNGKDKKLHSIVSCLHIAVALKENRAIDTILKYQSQN
jgi:hypothetical protein